MDELKLGYTGAIISSTIMLLLGIGWNAGFYVGAAEQMAKWHLIFSPSITGILGGILGGILESAIISFIILYAFGKVYNTIAR